MIKSQNLQVVRYFVQLTLSIFNSYIHNKDVQIIIQNTKSSEELRQCVQNNLQRTFIFSISVGSAPKFVIWQKHLIFEMSKSQDLQVVRYFDQLTFSIIKSYIHDIDIQIIIQNVKSI